MLIWLYKFIDNFVLFYDRRNYRQDNWSTVAKPSFLGEVYNHKNNKCDRFLTWQSIKNTATGGIFLISIELAAEGGMAVDTGMAAGMDTAADIEAAEAEVRQAVEDEDEVSAGA